MGKYELDKLKVQSFVTSLIGRESKTVKGGGGGTEIDAVCNTDTTCVHEDTDGNLNCYAGTNPLVCNDGQSDTCRPTTENK